LPIILLLMHTNHLEFFRTLRRNEPIFFLFTISSLLAPFVVFLFADTGRVIYFISMHTFIFLITLNSFGLVKYKAIPPITSYQWKIQNLFFLYYILLWRMPHIR